jgi:dihydroorotate dehydrogenase
LSGAPLRPITNAILAQTVARLAGRLPVIASAGCIHRDAREKLDMGACLVQLYTA